MQRECDDKPADKFPDEPGLSTALLVHSRRSIGSGDKFESFDEFTLDTATLAELRHLERQAAQELGQWTKRQEATATPSPNNFFATLEKLYPADEALDAGITELENRKPA